MGYLREGINAHVREFFDTRLKSTFIQRNPLLYFLGLNSFEGMTKLGEPGAKNPKSAAVFGGASMGKAELESKLGSIGRTFKYEKTEPNDGTTVQNGGSTPVASGFAEDNQGMSESRWVHFREPLKIRTHSLMFAQGEAAIGSIVEESAQPVWRRFQKRINTMLWFGGTGATGSSVNMNTQALQDEVLWREPLGLIYTLTANNIHNRVNRTTVTQLNPKVIAAGTAFGDTIVNLDINRLVNNGYVDRTSSAAVDGMANNSPNGRGVNLFITTSALFNELASQADARGIHQIVGGMPNHSVTGFEYPILEHDGVYYVWDKDCPAGTMIGLDLESFLVEVAPQANFSFTGFTDKSKTEEGGGLYEWGNYESIMRVSCHSPWLNVRITGLTTS
jgi:hypothetical protein